MKQRARADHWPAGADALPLVTLSRLTAIDVSDLSRYRSGDKNMSAKTRERIEVAANVSPDSELVRSHAPTLARVAALIRSQTDAVEVLSVLSRALQQARQFASKEEVRAFEARPPKTGSAGWDRLLAGVAEDFHCASIVRDEPQPAWTVERGTLREWWSPFDYGDRFSWAFRATPIRLRERGVVLNGGELESV